MRITDNFTLEELTASATAKSRGIKNTPDVTCAIKLTLLLAYVLQPIRDRYRKPIRITSGYRCAELNKAVGGVAGSDHTYGCAVDIKSNYGTKKENRELFNLIKDMITNGEIKVKQLINEQDYSWIHISFQDGRTSRINHIIE